MLTAYYSRGCNSKEMFRELKKEYSHIDCFDWTGIVSVLGEIFDAEKVPFIFIIEKITK